MKKIILTTIITVCTVAFSFGQTSVKDFYEADLKAMRKQHKADFGSELPKEATKDIIKVEDLQNGYISYSLMPLGVTGYKEMAYYTSNNGKKFVAIASFACGPVCGLWDLLFFEMQDGELVDKTSTYFPTSLRNQVEEVWKDYKNKEGKSIWIKVPQYGTSIKIGYFNGYTMDFEPEHFNLLAELEYNVATGTFTFVKK